MTTEKYQAWSDYRDQGNFSNPYQPGSDSWIQYEEAVTEINNQSELSSLGGDHE